MLTSYMLKTAFLFEMEKFPDDKFWSKEQLLALLHGMLNFILTESKAEELGSFRVLLQFATMKGNIVYYPKR